MAAGDLTTLASVREFMNLSSGQTATDVSLGSLVTQASAAICRYAGREFAPASSAATARKFRYEGGGYLFFAPYDLQTTTLVRIDTEGAAPTDLTAADDYVLLPLNAPQGVYTHMEMRNLGPASQTSARDYTPSRQITITGTWGFSTVPDDVKLAANITCAWLMRNHAAMPGKDLGVDADRFGPAALPSSVKRLLEHYTVRVF